MFGRVPDTDKNLAYLVAQGRYDEIYEIFNEKDNNKDEIKEMITGHVYNGGMHWGNALHISWLLKPVTVLHFIMFCHYFPGQHDNILISFLITAAGTKPALSFLGDFHFGVRFSQC